MNIILASSSLGRKKILTDLGLKFKIIPANIDEEKILKANSHLSPTALLKKIAKEKAMAVARILRKDAGSQFLTTPHLRQSLSLSKPSCYDSNLKKENQSGVKKFVTGGQSLVIAADSMVLFGGKLNAGLRPATKPGLRRKNHGLYGKPKSRSQAKRMLKMLSGKTHWFITGLCVIDSNTAKIYQRSSKTKVIFQKFTDKEINKYISTSPVTTHAGAYSTDDKFINKRCKLIGSETNVVGLPLEKLLPILKLASQGSAL